MAKAPVRKAANERPCDHCACARPRHGDRCWSLSMSEGDIAGRYRLEGRLGFGGMSTVHLALDLRLERQVAVKLLAEHLADDPTFVSRFQREAQAAARLVHPNIVQIFDSGLDERTGRHFIVMEYIEGQSCAEILRDDGWVEVDEGISIIEQACEGLNYAHRHGVVHRDVKPGNLLRAREGEVKLADFGIAKATEQSSITQVGSVLGTAAYLAPEQARGEEAGPRADLYALGVVAYQLLSGRLPYEATSLTELALKQQQEEPPTLDTLVAAVSPALADAIAIALALDPRDRYQTAREMGRALTDGAHGIAPAERPSTTRTAPATAATSLLTTRGRGGSASSGAPTTVTPRRPRPGPARREPPPVAQASRSAPRQRRRGRRLFLALFALLAIAVAIVAVVVATAPAPTKVVLRNVVYNDVQQTSSALKQLVSENTK
jgi:serine/threonine protein kinase